MFNFIIINLVKKINIALCYNFDMRIFLLVFLFILGAAFGSFICCQVRRFRMREEGKKKFGNRSVCLSCGYKLRWFDNVPILSWILLCGRCRKCHKKIGYLEIFSEISMAILFLLFGLFSGDFFQFSYLQWAIFGVTLVFLVSLFFLAIYDGRYGELPQSALTFSVICGTILSILKQWSMFLSIGSLDFLEKKLASMMIGVLILSGTYFLLYFLSKGRLVGDGDWILGLAISFALSDWWLSLLVMFLSNFLAAIVMVHVTKMKKGTKVFFGPWMILGYVIVLIGMEAFVNVF